MIADRNSGWLERTCKCWQGAKRLSCKLDWKFAAKSHLHPHIDGTGCTSVEGEEGGGQDKNEEGNRERESQRSAL